MINILHYEIRVNGKTVAKIYDEKHARICASAIAEESPKDDIELATIANLKN